MAPKTLKEKLGILVQVVSQHPDGISVEEIGAILTESTPKRTLQYRLSSLVKAGILRIEGSGRNNKYYPGTVSTEEVVEIPQSVSIIPISIEAQKIKKLISIPVQLRQHVSYQREFLDSYEPNKTFYLPENTREKLFKLGSGVEKGRPAGTYARK